MFRGSVVALVVTSAVAAARPVRLDVTVDACPGLAAKVREVSTFDPSATASVAITERAGVATILLADGHGTAFGPRVVEAANCGELATAVSMIVAMALPTIADGVDRIPQLGRAAAVEAPPPTSETELAVAIDPPAATSHTSLGVGFARSSIGNAITIGTRFGSAQMSLGGELAGTWLPTIAIAPGAEVDVTRFAVAAVPCIHRGSLGLCGVVRAGFDRGRGSGLSDARTVELPLLELGTRAVWERPLTDRFALQLHAELVAAVTSSVLTVDQMAVWHSNRYEALAGAAMLVRFP